MPSKTSGDSRILLVELARAAAAGDALATRAAAMELSELDLSTVACPVDLDPTELVIAAALVELFAQRRGCDAPAWVHEIGALDEPRFLVKLAARMPHLRAQCERESPPPLRSRNLFSPANYLTWV